MRKDLIIYGADGLGRELEMIVSSLDEWNLIGFFDDALPTGSEVGSKGLPILDVNEILCDDSRIIYVAIGVADPKCKKKLFEKLEKYQNVILPTIIASTSIISPDAAIGCGSIIGHFCILGPNTKLGKGVLMNSKAAIGHDTVVGDYCTILTSTNISGNVTIGSGSFFGDQSFVIQKRTIGKNVKVGAGSRVFTNVPDGWSVFGYPAQRIN
jgi:sugar O-acyltransferase (sialic acid O-acetyltransferase NeuD family)